MRRRTLALTSAVVIVFLAGVMRPAISSSSLGSYPPCADLSSADGNDFTVLQYDQLLTISAEFEPAAQMSSDSRAIDEDATVSRFASGILGTVIGTGGVTVLFDPAVVSEAALREAAEGIGDLVTFTSSCRSIAEITAAYDLITESRGWYPGANELTYGIWFDVAAQQLVVTFDESGVDAAEALAKTLGDLVRVEIGQASRLTRNADAQPHYGGARIHLAGQTGYCSSGFAIVKAGVRQSVTAGHCFVNGNSIFSGAQAYGSGTGKLSFPTYDMMRIHSSGQTYTDNLYTDPLSPTTRDVTGRSDPTLNQFVCQSGQATRGICGVKVKDTAAQFCDAAGCTPNLIFAEDLTRTVSTPGDSGGPMFVVNGGNGATIGGMIIAHTASTNFFAHKVSRMESLMAMTVATTD